MDIPRNALVVFTGISGSGKSSLAFGTLFAEVLPRRAVHAIFRGLSLLTPQGACPVCHGQGHVYEVPEKLLVPDDSLTIRERAIAAWPPAGHGQNLRDILIMLGFDVDKPWRALPKKDRD